MTTLARGTVLIGVAALTLIPARSVADQSDDGLVFIGKAARSQAERPVAGAIVIGDDLIVAGKVDGIAAAIGGDVHVLGGSDVDGAVLAIGGRLNIDDAAKVTGPQVSIPGGGLAEISAQLSSQRRSARAESWGPGVKRPHNSLVTLVLGWMVLALGVSIPFAGAAVILVVTASAVGTALVSRFGTRQPASAAHVPGFRSPLDSAHASRS